jgi:hypothetical protein
VQRAARTVDEDGRVVVAAAAVVDDLEVVVRDSDLGSMLRFLK